MYQPILLALLCALVHAESLSTTSRRSITVFTELGCNSLPVLVCSVQPTAAFPDTAGTVFFRPTWVPAAPGSDRFACYVRITAKVTGLSHNKHGFHIHTYGDVTMDDGSSTGGHFTNPAGDEIDHGFSDSSMRHWGDLDNLSAASDGTATYDRVDNVIRLGSVVGRGITIHEAEDMGPAEQPTGASGARVGHCVIGYANPTYATEL